MTCIIGSIDKGRVYIGADSAGVAGLDICVRKDVKVFKVGKFLFGCTTSFRMIQILQYSFKPKPQPKQVDTHAYMCTLFIDEVRDLFRKHGFLMNDKGVDKGGCFLVGYKGRLFTVDSDYQVGENQDGFASLGCGGDYAIGAILAMNTKIPVKHRILRALEISEYRSAGVRRPFKIMSI